MTKIKDKDIKDFLAEGQFSARYIANKLGISPKQGQIVFDGSYTQHRPLLEAWIRSGQVDTAKCAKIIEKRLNLKPDHIALLLGMDRKSYQNARSGGQCSTERACYLRLLAEHPEILDTLTLDTTEA